MAKVEIIMPKMGEGIIEATITRWLKKVGETIEEDESIVEIATDKVDSEIPASVSGVLSEIKYNEGDVVAIGEVIALMTTADNKDEDKPKPADKIENLSKPDKTKTDTPVKKTEASDIQEGNNRFYSPLVKSIAKKKGFQPMNWIPLPARAKRAGLPNRMF
jgi:2-oxoglutarate dehydrogenase E2 component (dihydrolipoamide succinyltransferase)